LKATQLEFASQLSITRERLASYEDSRAPLRCDIGLRLCRQFFVSEFWMATGCVDDLAFKKKERWSFGKLETRLTMSLATQPVGLSLIPGVGFAEGFDPHLRAEWLKLARASGSFPRIVPLPSDNPSYAQNAIDCLIEFWKRGLAPDQWGTFLVDLAFSGNTLNQQLREMMPNATAEDHVRLLEGEWQQRLLDKAKVKSA
jgi:hypothetical protein